MWSRLGAFVRGIRRRREIEREADEELQFHLDREIAAHLARGVSPVEARRRALASLGGLTQTSEAIRNVRTLGVGALGSDVRDAVRALVGHPRFSSVALTTIVLMVGGITVVFAMVQAVLLRPLPYPDADRLVLVRSTQPKRFSTDVTLSDARTFEQDSRTTEAWGLYRPRYMFTLDEGSDRPLMVQDLKVTVGLLPMLGIDVVLGRALLPSDAEPGAPSVALINHELWQARYGGSHDVLHEHIRIGKTAVAIVGVTEAGVELPGDRSAFRMLTVLRLADLATEGDLGFRTLARVRSGVTVQAARAELEFLARRLESERPGTHRERVSSVIPILDQLVGDYKRVLWTAFAAVSAVMLIGISNLISLYLARNGDREREITLRAALGASRSRLARQLIVESVVLSVIGGVVGLASAAVAARAIVASLPAGFPRAGEIAIDWSVGLFAALIALLVGIAVGAVPAWQALRIDLTSRLNEAGRSATLGTRRSRLQRAIIAVETGVALVVLIAAALLAHSYHRLTTRETGMHEGGLVVVQVSLPGRIREGNAQRAFWVSALDGIRSVPGVQSASVVNTSGPLSGSDTSLGGVQAAGDTRPPSDGLSVSWRRVGPHYFETLGLPILKGRSILDSDQVGSEAVAVVNELTAEALWPGENPIGKRLGQQGGARGRLWTVVGLIPGYRHTRLTGDAEPQMYIAFAQDQNTASGGSLVVRSDPASPVPPATLAARITAIEPEASVTVTSIADRRWTLAAPERFRTALLAVFAGTAVFLALVGILGLVSYTVGLRQREIAIRVALGAMGTDVLGVAMRQAVRPALLGLLCGVTVATFAARLLTTFLVDISAVDLPTYALSVAMFAAATVLAGYLPARRALSVDPVETLRHE